ncbi:MAG: citrate synthase [Bacteroidetes bacterium]|nr:citrate synthase [Bacteroidota bacterium]
MVNSLQITDSRTQKQYTIPIENGAIRTMELRNIKVNDDDFGIMGYDPAFMNTASVKSKITYIDGDKGILRYRGYPIEQLAEESHSFLEVAYLIFHGELPTKDQLDEWRSNIMSECFIPESIATILKGFDLSSHPMGMLVSLLGALSTLYPESQNIHDPTIRMKQVYRLMGHTPTLCAMIFRHTKGLPFQEPNLQLSYSGNFLAMTFGTTTVHPVFERAMRVLLILHADHEQNCSTNVMRCIGSSLANPYAAAAGATAALWGPLHGGANEEVLKMLDEIRTIENVPAFIKEVKEGKRRLMGFGHRVYKNYDPRARVIKQLAYEVFEVTGKNPKLEIALALEKIALEDEYFIKRRLYPNVDFYSGLIYQAMGFPTNFFTVLFALGRMIGWLAQWNEHITDPEQKIARPRQVYVGYDERPYIPINQR